MKKPFNWDRMIYIIVLILLSGVLGYYGYVKLLLVRADGQILFENIDVRLTADSRIMKYFVEEDDTIEQGDTLFSYRIYYLPGNTTNTNYNEWMWIDKEIYNLENRIAQDQIIIDKNAQLIADVKDKLNRMNQEVILDVLPKDQLESAQTQLANLSAQSKQMSAEIAQANNMIAMLYAKKSVLLPSPSGGSGEFANSGIRNTMTDVSGMKEGDNYFISPIDGAVNRVYTGEFEVALKQDEIMALRSSKQMYIKAFIAQEDAQYIHVNDLVDVDFPNGKSYKGFVKRFHQTTYTLPPEYQKNFEPITRDIAIDVYLVDRNKESEWQSFYKMGVKISKFKY